MYNYGVKKQNILYIKALFNNDIRNILSMISTSKITEIFCSIDDFCNDFPPFWHQNLLSNGKKRIRKSKLS